MPRRKVTETTTLDNRGAKIGEPVPKAVIDTKTAAVGVPGSLIMICAKS